MEDGGIGFGQKRRLSRGQFDITFAGRRLIFRTQAGVFSQDGPDEGSVLLLETVLQVVRPHQTLLDLGAGVGLIGLCLAPLLPRGEVWLVDSDIRAVRLVEENIALNHAENTHVVLSDITLDLPRMRFDLVVSNPPTHSGKEVLEAFVRESHEILRPGGRLYLVVNRLLSTRDVMAEAFGNVDQVARSKGFVVFAARKTRKVSVAGAGGRQ